MTDRDDTLWTNLAGFRGEREWLDISEYVVHFTSPGSDYKEGIDRIQSIYWDRTIRRGPKAFGAARRIAEIRDSQRCVCLSEVPLGYLSRLAQRRSEFGIAFSKDFIVRRGGAPVWYLEYGSAPQLTFKRMIERIWTEDRHESDLWMITPFIEYPGSPPSAPYLYRFEWEREWRVAADLAFNEDDVAFLVIPERLHEQARGFFEDAMRDNLGPAYLCPYVDAKWSIDRVREALSGARGLADVRRSER